MLQIAGSSLEVGNFVLYFSCSWTREVVHWMYVCGIYMIWTSMYMNMYENTYLLGYIVYTLYKYCMDWNTSLLFVNTCLCLVYTLYIHCTYIDLQHIYMPVHVSSCFIRDSVSIPVYRLKIIKTFISVKTGLPICFSTKQCSKWHCHSTKHDSFLFDINMPCLNCLYCNIENQHLITCETMI
jgi:hypothetical protein